MSLNPSMTNESEVLVSIDSFIQSICRYELINEHYFISTLKQLIPPFNSIYQPHLEYRYSVMLFKKMIDDLYNTNRLNYLDHLSRVEIFVLLRKVQYKNHDVTCESLFLQGQEKKNRVSLKTYLENLMLHYSKLLFIRIDLAIQYEFQHEIGIQQFNDYFRVFLNRVQNKDTCFQDLHGYAWAIEQGESKGYHCHVLLIYDGHKHQQDYGLGMRIGACWKELTEDKGYFFLSNTPAYKKRFQQKGSLGIGMIHRKDPLQVANAINAAMYLVNPEKDKQHLRVRVKGMRTFGKGVYHVGWRRHSIRTKKVLGLK